MKFQSIVASALSIACSFCVLTSLAATTAPRTESASRQLTQDEEWDLKNGALSVDNGVVVDLNGFNLTYNNVAGTSTGVGTITNSSSKLSTLTFNVASAKTFKNSTFWLKGNLKVVKTGAGTLTLSDTNNSLHTYSGGTDVQVGTLNTAKYGGTNSDNPFGKPNLVTVRSGALFDSNGVTKFKTSDVFTLDGGTYDSSYNQKTAVQVQSFVLTANSKFSLSNITILGGSFDLGGFTLEVVPTASLTWRPSSIVNGTIYLNSGNFALGAAVGLPASGKPTANLNLGSSAVVTGEFTYSVNDLTVAEDASVAGPIHVYGAYRPNENGTVCDKVVMQNESTLDISGLGAAAELKAANFAAGSITLAFGGRELGSNETVVAWDGQPADVSFNYTGTAIDATKFSVSDSGIVYDASVDTIASAVWTGDEGDGDWLNPNIWTLKNARGNQITPDRSALEDAAKDLVVNVSGDISGLTFNGDFPFAGINLNAEVAETLDLSAFDLGLISADSLIDLKGNTLKLQSVSGACTCSATVTNSVNRGMVEWTIPEGESFTNGTLTLVGALDLKKLGAGTFVAAKCPQEFDGVTIVQEGVLKPGLDHVNAINGKSPFGGQLTVNLEEGGILDPAGSYAWAYHTVNLNGGMISNTVARQGRGSTATGTASNQFNPKLNLFADTVFATTEMFNFEGCVLVQDKDAANTLEIRVPSGKTFLWGPKANEGYDYATKDLHLKVAGGGTLEIWQRIPVVAEKNPGFIFEVVDATLNMAWYKSAANFFEGGMGVVDYISSCSSDKKNINIAVLSVSGTFTPNTDYFYGATLKDGAVIDLTGRTEAFSIDSKDTGVSHTLQFEGGKVTLDLGARALEFGQQILAWETRPQGVEFAFSGDNVDGTTQVVYGDDGLFYGYAKEPESIWTNAKGNFYLTDPENWDNGLPTTIKATFTGDVAKVAIPAGETFDAQRIWFNNAELSQDADFSWLNPTNITDESVLDIKGHVLTLKGVEGACTSAGTITSSEENGLVKFDVPAGSTYTNANLKFDGKLAFKKVGEGILVAAKYPQTYTGKTTVKGGILRCSADQNMNAQDGFSPFGASCTVVLEKGTFLDPAGSYAWGYHTIEMNGGIISNTVAQIGANSTAFNAGSFPKPFNPTLALNSDSLFASPVQFNFKGVIQPNGYKLTVNTPAELRWAPTKVNGAEVEFTGGGSLVTLKNTIPVMTDISLVMNNFTFDVGTLMVVSNYTAAAGTKDPVPSKDAWHGVGGMTVSGTFTPTALKFFGCQMLDGSTINLSGKTGTWSTTTDSSYKNGPLTVTFAEGATITIDVHGRDFAGKNKQIVSWKAETKPENLEKLTFVLDAQSKQAGYKLVWDDDGIYAEHSGLLLMLK